MKDEPAFAQQGKIKRIGRTTGDVVYELPDHSAQGLTKRELFAAMCFNGLLVSGFSPDENEIASGKLIGEIAAERAINWANALLKQLEETK